MHVDIVIDTICPWCYVGKRRFERALAIGQRSDIAIGWRAFQLNPDLPAPGIDRATYLAQKFGDAARAATRYAPLIEAGAQEGIDFRFNRIMRTPNTVLSHRLVRYAARHGRGAETVEGIFRSYFTEGVDIGAAEVLGELAASIGLNAGEVRRYLASEADDDAVREEDAMARGLGINGVPCFIIDGRYAVSGAQSPEIFLQVFGLAREGQAAEAAAE